jgi:3-oxoacyl-[acyl-carrier protein] reductase
MASGRLEGKVAIVAGAGSGFGEGIARRFAAEEAKAVEVDGGRRI